MVEIDHIPGYIYGYNRGCRLDGLEEYREGQKWRRKLIAELQRRPEWIAEWRAAKELDRRIEELCEAKGLRFALHECPLWRAPDELPPDFRPSSVMYGYEASLLQAVRLRRQLIAEIEAER